MSGAALSLLPATDAGQAEVALMLTGIAVGTGIMLTYLALIRFAGKKLGHDVAEHPFETRDVPPQDRS